MSHVQIRLLSFDPGLSTTGWNVSQYDTKTCKLRVLRFGMLTPNQDADTPQNRDFVRKYGQRIMTLSELRIQVRALVDANSPDIIVSEDAFYNPVRPSAYCALLQWITTLDLLLHDEYQKVLFKISPALAKRVTSGFGMATKKGMQYAILHQEDIEFKPKVVDGNLTEHICDSIGIAYTFCHEIFPSLHDLWTYGYIRKPNEPVPSPSEIRSHYC